MNRGAALQSLNSLAHAIFSACLKDLPDMHYQYRKPGQPESATVNKSRRPDHYDLMSVVLFQQMWGSTALGFGGMGGAAMTTADVVIVEGPDMARAVYFGCRFAYCILRPNDLFMSDMRNHCMVNVSRAKSRYEKETQ